MMSLLDIAQGVLLSLIERCIACGVVVNEQRLNQVRKPYVDMDELLDINLKVAKCDEPTETNLLTYELSRYVIPQAVNPFFHDNQYANLQIKTEEEDIEVDELIWKNFAESSIRLTANNELRVEIQSELEQIQSFRSATEEERIEIRKQLATEFLDTIIDNGEDENTNSINSENQQYSDSAYSLLKKHESKYDLQNLKPINLARGFISKYAFNLGWDTNFFIAKPNGGKPEEIIGVDVAISRRYDEGHQGSRSPIATFAEKYVWAATNELIGYFADRVAAHAWQKCFEPPVSLSLFCEVINPAATISSNDLDFKENLDFSELIPDIELTESIQMDRANEWVRKAPLPDIEPLLSPNKKIYQYY